jgi:translation initiation factor IF-1
VNLPSGEAKEGLVIEVIGRGRVRVDCGDQVRLVSVLDCTILKGATELEIGDKVEMQPQGSFLYFTGEIVNINHDGTYDIAMEAEVGEEADIETNVPRENIRKLASNRLKAQFKKGGWAVVAIHAFASSASMKGPVSEK